MMGAISWHQRRTSTNVPTVVSPWNMSVSFRVLGCGRDNWFIAAPSAIGLFETLRHHAIEATRIAPMSDLTARLETLLHNLRLFAASSDHSHDAQTGEQFRKDLASLIAEYGHDAVSAALDKMPDCEGPSVWLH